MDSPWGTTVCCATGPSFSEEQAQIVVAAQREGRCRVIVVNDAWRRVPSADELYAADRKWWEVHIAAVRARFGGELWTQDERAAQAFGLNHVVLQRGNWLLPHGDPRITCGSNSGFQAIMRARLRGATRILLVGYDMQRTGGKKHFFGDHKGPLANGDPRGFVKHFDAVAPMLRAEGTDVVNCSIATALTCFQRADLAATLMEETCSR